MDLGSSSHRFRRGSLGVMGDLADQDALLALRQLVHFEVEAELAPGLVGADETGRKFGFDLEMDELAKRKQSVLIGQVAHDAQRATTETMRGTAQVHSGPAETGGFILGE